MNIFDLHRKTITSPSAEPLPEEEWPTEWKRVFYKTYPRFPRISLAPFVRPISFDLIQAIDSRRSRRDFSEAPVTVEELANLLYYSGRVLDSSESRAYPSGGARYPLEVYPLVFRSSQELPEGLYHWNVKENALEVLFQRRIDDEEKDRLLGQAWAKKSAIVIFISAVIWRSEVKYKDKAYRLILLEAGHLCQNLYLISRALGLKGSALAGFYDGAVNTLIGLERAGEATIYSFVLGK